MNTEFECLNYTVSAPYDTLWISSQSSYCFQLDRETGHLLLRLYSPSWTPGSLQRSPSALQIIRPDEGLWNPCMYRRNDKEKHFEFSEYVTVTQGKARIIVARRMIVNTVIGFRRISVCSFRNYCKSNIWLAMSCKSVSAGSLSFVSWFFFVS
jgi:hypothetical protein